LKFFTLVLSSFIGGLLAFQVSAATVTLNDGDSVDYYDGIELQLAGELSSANRFLTYGFNFDPGESITFKFLSPIDLGVIVSTYANGAGTVILNPNGDYSIHAGVPYEFTLSGDVFVGRTNWLTIGFLSEDMDDPNSSLNVLYGGTIDVVKSNLFAGTENLYVPSGSQLSPVPLPATGLLLIGGIAGLSFLRRRQAPS